VVVVGNLPFSVSTELLIKWVRQVHHRTGGMLACFLFFIFLLFFLSFFCFVLFIFLFLAFLYS
jgi:hypothetical protein